MFSYRCLTCAPISARDRLSLAGSVESSGNPDLARSLFSKMRYKTPMITMMAPPDKLFLVSWTLQWGGWHVHER